MSDCENARDLRLGELVRAQFAALGRRVKPGDVVHVYRDDVRAWLEDEALCAGRGLASCPDCAHLVARVTAAPAESRRDMAMGRFVRHELFLSNDPTLERTVVAVGSAQVRAWL